MSVLDKGTAQSQRPEDAAASSVSSTGVRARLPGGYRQGVITAITVFIGFSLSFLQYWAFESPGEWTPTALAVLFMMMVPIFGQITALYRALRVEDDNEKTYHTTVKWFVWSVFGMLLAVCIAALVLSQALKAQA